MKRPVPFQSSVVVRYADSTTWKKRHRYARILHSCTTRQFSMYDYHIIIVQNVPYASFNPGLHLRAIPSRAAAQENNHYNVFNVDFVW